MLLVIHIIVAVSSLLATSLAWIRPGKTKLYPAYGLTALTLISGTALVITSPVHILQTCLTGLAYTGIVSVGLVAARSRLKQPAYAPAPALAPSDTPESTSSDSDPQQTI